MSTPTNTILEFRRIESRDLQLLHAWFNQRHVQLFYSLHQWSFTEIEQKFAPILDCLKPIDAYIAYRRMSGRLEPLGYIQSYRTRDFPFLAKLEPLESDLIPFELSASLINEAAGIDLFIGEPSDIGKGWGKLLLKAYIDQKLRSRFRYILADCESVNEASLALFASSGFVAKGTFDVEDDEKNRKSYQLLLFDLKS